MKTIYTACLWVPLISLGCGSPSPESGTTAVGHAPEHGTAPDDTRPVVRAGTPPPPITGGTLLVTDDGAYALASDPDRDLVHIVDLATSKETATLSLDSGARPFRLAQDAAGLVHITLRGSGQVIAVDPVSGALITTTTICPNPRGIAFVEATNTMAVACAGGELVRVDADTGEITRRDRVAPDLRDVLLDDDTLLVTRFRSAEVLAVDSMGVSTARGAPLSLAAQGRPHAPSTAWRTFPMPYGGWMMLHQLANTAPLDASRPEESGHDDADTGFEGDAGTDFGGDGYGGGEFGPPCGGAVHPALSAMRPDGSIIHGMAVQNVALAVDAAMSPDGQKIVVAVPSQHNALDGFELESEVGLIEFDLRDFDGSSDVECDVPNALDAFDDFVAVAFEPNGSLIAQTRASPSLYRITDGEVVEVIDLAGDEVVDTGHDLFHKDTGAGLACASCHPEGGDDGRVWSFTGIGPRRTQPLNVGLRGTEPFHWDGDMADMAMLVHEVRGRRMGGQGQPTDRVDALQAWVFEMPQPNPMRKLSDAAATKGATLFLEYGCQECHSGPNLTSNAYSDLGGGPIQIPTLHGVSRRAPFMHDGSAPTLAAATRDMLALTPSGAQAPADDVDAMVAYLEAL